MKTVVAKIGSIGNESYDINYILQKLGYKVTGVIDIFDSQTKISIEAFQNDSGLPITGMVDTDTLTSMKNIFKVRFPDDLIKQSEAEPVFGNYLIVKDAKKETKLREGDKDEKVTIAQMKLIKFEFLSGVADGILGEKTKKAIEKFQEANNLTVDGEIGEKTWEKLDNYIPKKEQSKGQTRKTLRQGDYGVYVELLQEKLIKYGYLVDNADGIFGEETKLAVKKFQLANGLKDDGIVGQKTWFALDNNPAKLISYKKELGLSMFGDDKDAVETFNDYDKAEGSLLKTKDTRPTLRRGSTGSYVVTLQQTLINYGFLTGTADGKFGAATEEAVKKFQRANGITSDGVVGSGTWRALDNYLPDLPSKPTLRRGDTGAYVVMLQEKLINYGFLTGTADGKFGAVTEEAVKKFQKANGLVTDGVVASGTWRAIDNYLDLPSKPTLRRGDSGAYVVMLQEKLISYGFLTGTADGRFGAATEDAVRRFQRASGITPDGVVGSGTWRAIDNYLPDLPSKPTLRRGDSGAYVVMLQEKLIEFGFLTGTADGKFGAGTEDAVRRFQRANGITPDGVVGSGTWRAIDNYLPDLPSKPTLRRGDSGAYVVMLQEKLIEFGFLTGTADGKFGAGTEDAVRRFQRANGITSDGVVGSGTWRAIDNYLPDLPNKPTLRRGDTGAYVVMLQKKLIEFGFLTGTADGKFGAGTEEAVKKFQKANGLVADGVVGAGTWNAIDTYVPGQPSRPTLRYGDSGDYVVILQEKLKEIGFFSGRVDGDFGNATLEAVKLFQAVVGLSADGVVGQKTWEALDSYTVVPSPEYPTLRQGDSGEYVLILQQKLKDFGFFTGIVDGLFGANTKEAVIRFQSSLGLTADGIVGPTTWEAIFNYTEEPEDYPTIRYGSSGHYVIILQTRLKELGYFNGSITGSFDAVTEAAVIKYQKDNGLTPDGVVGTKTWVKLFPDGSGNGGGSKPVLRPGDTGEYVIYLQEELKKLMYYDGEITGIFDSRTTSAVKAFQSANRLTVDGIVGNSTWSALRSLYPPIVNC